MKKTGEHISAFIARRKIELLNSIMRDQSPSLNEIAEKMGFSSYYYFYRYVKHTTGEAPQKMRDRLIKEMEKNGSSSHDE